MLVFYFLSCTYHPLDFYIHNIKSCIYYSFSIISRIILLFINVNNCYRKKKKNVLSFFRKWIFIKLKRDYSSLKMYVLIISLGVMC